MGTWQFPDGDDWLLDQCFQIDAAILRMYCGYKKYLLKYKDDIIAGKWRKLLQNVFNEFKKERIEWRWRAFGLIYRYCELGIPISKKLRNQALTIVKQYTKWLKEDKNKTAKWRNYSKVLKIIREKVIPTLNGEIKIDTDKVAWFLYCSYTEEISMSNLGRYYDSNFNRKQTDRIKRKICRIEIKKANQQLNYLKGKKRIFHLIVSNKKGRWEAEKARI